jgi:hypothetical protein
MAQIDWAITWSIGSLESNTSTNSNVWTYAFLTLLLIQVVIFSNLGIAIFGKAHADTTVENGMMEARHNRELAEWLLDQEVLMF